MSRDHGTKQVRIGVGGKDVTEVTTSVLRRLGHVVRVVNDEVVAVLIAADKQREAELVQDYVKALADVLTHWTWKDVSRETEEP